MAENSNLPEQPALLPPVDIVEDAGGITLYADLPGVPRDKLNIYVDGESLVIQGEMGLEMPRNLEATHIEVNLPRYRRVFTLSKELDSERMSAELKQGVLKLRLPKSEQARPRRVNVTAG